MKVRMKTLSAGPSGVRTPGQVVDVDSAGARALVAGGYAEYVELQHEAEPVETATVSPPEQAVRVRPKKARRK